MDFSFVEARRQGSSTQGPPTSDAQTRPGLHIPTFSEVQAPQQPHAAPLNSLFQPKGLFAAHHQQHQQRNQLQQAPAQPAQQQHQPHMVLPPPTPSVHAQQGMQGHSTGVPLQHFQPNSYPPPSSAAQGPPAQGVAGPSHTYQQPLNPADSTLLVVSRRQQGNPVLKHIRNVRWVFGDIGPDYQLGSAACALFLSLRYHLLHPTYFMYRIKELGRTWALRVLLVLVDVEEVVKPLADITKAAVLNDCTLICAWSPEEAGRYLETFKAYQNKPAANIQARVEGDYVSRLTSTLTAVRAVNRTDAMALGAQFGTLADVLQASKQDLSACPGIGPTKVQNLWDAFNKPFRRPATAGLPASGVVVRQEPNVAEPAPGAAAEPGAGLMSGGQGGLADATTSLPQQAAQAVEDVELSLTNSHDLPAGKRMRHMDVMVGPEQQDELAGDHRVDAGFQDNQEQVLGIRGDGSDEADEGEQGDEPQGVDDDESDDQGREDDLVYMASQIMLKVQAGAAVTGADGDLGHEEVSGQEAWEEI